MQKIKEKSKEILLSSTILGLPKVLSKQNTILKAIWFLAFLASTSVGVFTVIKTLNNYLDHEVTTKIDIVHKIPSEFPQGSICRFKFTLETYNLKQIFFSYIFCK